MKLESVCPLTTNSSSELFVFKTSDIYRIKDLFKDCNGRDFSDCVQLVEQIDCEGYEGRKSTLKYVFDEMFGYSDIEDLEKLLNVSITDVPLAVLGSELRKRERADFYCKAGAYWEILKKEIISKFEPFTVLEEEDNALMACLYGHTKDEKPDIHDSFLKRIYKRPDFIAHEHLG